MNELPHGRQFIRRRENDLDNATEYSTPMWLLAVYLAVAALIPAGMIFLSWLLGPRHHDAATDEPYESGIVSTGSARLRLSAKYYLIAMFFVIFDLETAFVFAWAAAFREAGWPGYVGMMVFFATIAAALVYLWREGALDWGTRRRRENENGKNDEKNNENGLPRRHEDAPFDSRGSLRAGKTHEERITA